VNATAGRGRSPRSAVSASRPTRRRLTVLADPQPPRWFYLDFAAIADVDYTGAQPLRTILHRLREHSVQAAFSEVPDRVRKLLDRYRITDLVGAEHIYPDPRDVLAAYEHATEGRDRTRTSAASDGPTSDGSTSDGSAALTTSAPHTGA